MVAARAPGAPLSMKIAIGSDHAGFELKQRVAPLLEGAGHEVVDVGTGSEESTDYPLYAASAARLVAGGEADRAVLVCGSGVGVSIVANKVDGVRAVNAHDPEEAEMSRRHNDANVLALAGRRLEPEAGRSGDRRALPRDRVRGRSPPAPRRPDRRRRAGPAMPEPPDNFQTAPLAEVDPEIAEVLERELEPPAVARWR